MRQPSRSPIVVGLLVTCIGSTATAQSVVTGAITGTLTDAGKKAMRTADVMARNVDTKREATATTDDEGRFRIVGLQPGHYIVEVTAPGFTSLASRERRGRGRAGHDRGSLARFRPLRMPDLRQPTCPASTPRGKTSPSASIRRRSTIFPTTAAAGPTSHSWRPRPPRMVRSERSVFAASAAC